MLRSSAFLARTGPRQTLFSEKLQEVAAAGGLSGEADDVVAATASLERTPVMVAVHDCDPGADPEALEVWDGSCPGSCVLRASSLFRPSPSLACR